MLTFGRILFCGRLPRSHSFVEAPVATKCQQTDFEPQVAQRAAISEVHLALRRPSVGYGGEKGIVNLTVHGVRAGGWDHGAVTLRFGRTSPRSRS